MVRMTEKEAIEGFKIDNALLGENESGTVERNNIAIKCIEELQEYRSICDSPEKLKIIDELYLERCEEINKLTAELAEYKKLEDEGLLLRLPISEDTPVYSIEYCCGKNKENKMGMCFRGFCEGCSDKSYYIKEGKAKQCSISEINRSVFLTKEEAEQVLERMKEVQDVN